MEKLFELKVSLENISSPPWRRLALPETASLYDLHHAIQIAFGWTNSHLYLFNASGKIFGNPVLMNDDYMDGEVKVTDDKTVGIREILKKNGDKIAYEYDFGDSWLHTITLEAIKDNDADLKLPFCLDGAMAAPPEDCGGVFGFENLKTVMKSSKHPEYKELTEWLGKPIDPQKFHLQEVNVELKKFKSYLKEYEKGFSE
jgi:hypothetical protein